jgi:hypothetical protein
VPSGALEGPVKCFFDKPYVPETNNLNGSSPLSVNVILRLRTAMLLGSRMTLALNLYKLPRIGTVICTNFCYPVFFLFLFLGFF